MLQFLSLGHDVRLEELFGLVLPLDLIVGLLIVLFLLLSYLSVSVEFDSVLHLLYFKIRFHGFGRGNRRCLCLLFGSYRFLISRFLFSWVPAERVVICWLGLQLLVGFCAQFVPLLPVQDTFNLPV